MTKKITQTLFVKIKLAGAFRINRFAEESREVPAGTTVRQIVDALQLPEELLGIYVVNDCHANADYFLSDGDILTILPILDGG